MYKSIIRIESKNGLHIRITAEIVHKSDELKTKYNINLYVKREDAHEPLAVSMLALLSMKVRKDEVIEVSCKEDSKEGKQAVLELCEFIKELMIKDNLNFAKIDEIIEESTIANEQILKNIPMGILVIDKNCKIVSLNEYGLKIIDKEVEFVLGKYVKDIIPNSDLPNIIETEEPHIGEIQHINKSIVISNRAPIFANNSVIGAIGVFQDVSEMIGIKEVNEKFKRILEASHDLICFVDENRKISYINPAYEKHFNLFKENIVGKDLHEISPDGLRMKVYNKKEKIENFLCMKNNIDIIATIEPIFIDDNFKGVISILKSVDEIKNIMKELEESEEQLNYYKDELKRHSELESSFDNIIGYSSTLKDSLIIADKAAKSISTVLIRGESGTGKELISNAIHSNSDRKDKPLVRVNCAAIPENLLESELFGYEKGAFTGADKRKPGKFSIANGGTIFLDEIGDMPKSMQVKLLRVIQEKEFESVGGLTTQRVDVRIIAATNRNLEEMLITGEFREDLYYRLNVININLPPLRNRKEDINLLVEFFIKKMNKKLNKNVIEISKQALNYLQEYHWPGNIRELENIIERATNMCENDIIESRDLPFYITKITPRDYGLINISNGELKTMDEYEREIIKAAMEKYKSFNKAGKALGLTHRTISLKCKKYGIEREERLEMREERGEMRD